MRERKRERDVNGTVFSFVVVSHFSGVDHPQQIMQCLLVCLTNCSLQSTTSNHKSNTSFHITERSVVSRYSAGGVVGRVLAFNHAVSCRRPLDTVLSVLCLWQYTRVATKSFYFVRLCIDQIYNYHTLMSTIYHFLSCFLTTAGLTVHVLYGPKL